MTQGRRALGLALFEKATKSIMELGGRFRFYESMKSADEYRKNADECRKLGKAMSNAEHKALLEKMADSWDGLAADREKDPR